MVAIREEKMSMRKAAEAYGVPKSTLYDHVSSAVSAATQEERQEAIAEVEIRITC